MQYPPPPPVPSDVDPATLAALPLEFIAGEQERGSLALTAVLIQGAISVAAGASLTAHGSTFSNTLTVSGSMEAHETT